LSPSRRQTRSLLDLVRVGALVALALSVCGCGGKSESDVAHCIQKKGFFVRHQGLRVRHVYGGSKILTDPLGSGPLRVKTIIVPALSVETATNHVTIVFAKSDGQVVEAGFALPGTVVRVYAGDVAAVWDSQPRKDEARLVEGCLS